MPNMKVICGDYDPRVVALLRHHLAGRHENSPQGSVFALDQTGLKAFDVSFYTAWQDGELLGMGEGLGTGRLQIQMEKLIERCRPVTAERSHACIKGRPQGQMIGLFRSRG